MFQAVGAGRDWQLRADVAAGADRRELGGGDGGAVQRDRAYGRLGGDDVEVVYVEAG